MPEKTVSKIEFEMQQIERLLAAYAEQIDGARQQEPNLVEVTALASVLHSFYNGLENIFTIIAKEIDQNLPSGNTWHRDLLHQMFRADENRSPVISSKMTDRLTAYLGFRHFYRHSYSFFLDWQEMEPLIISLNPVWKDIKIELTSFVESLSTSKFEE